MLYLEMNHSRHKEGSAQQDHEEYLMRLGKRNLYIKSLKNDMEKEVLQEKEKNFSVYVNGANATLSKPKRFVRNITLLEQKAHESPSARQTHSHSCESLHEGCASEENLPVLNSMPNAEARPRKFWGQAPSALAIRNVSGKDVFVKPPDTFVSYSDNFSSDDDEIACNVGDSDKSISDASDLVEAIDTSLVIQSNEAKTREKCQSCAEFGSYSLEHTKFSEYRMKSGIENDPSGIQIFLYSNWHQTEKKIGLCAIQLFDDLGAVIHLTEKNVSYSGAIDITSSVASLVNNMTKTVKVEDMVLFQPTSLPVWVTINSSERMPTRLKLFNYNVQGALDFGVKFCKINCAGKTVFEGDIPRGCGNRIFDYGFDIDMKYSGKPSDQTMALSGPKRMLACKFKNEQSIQSHMSSMQKGPQKPLRMLESYVEQTGFDKSINSLMHFDSSHLGRLEASVDLEENFFSNNLKNFERKQVADVSRGDFDIPVLPEGSELVFNIRSTWGDTHYTGLNGIEIFADDGKPVKISKISADPSDINTLDGPKSDPRIVENLIDGHYCTKDDFLTWLTPFTAGSNHYVCMTFMDPCKIAMIRIWNYNKSRIHTSRGIRDVDIKLDGKLIFCGQITKASGIPLDTKNFGDTILFTTDEDILEKMGKYDITFAAVPDEGNGPDCVVLTDRPKTGRGKRSLNDGSEFPDETELIHGNSEDTADKSFCAKTVILRFTSNWGNESDIGLTGIDLLGEDENCIQLGGQISEITSGNAATEGNLKNLLNNENITTDHAHMVVFPFYKDMQTITVTLLQAKQLRGIRVWNYNGSADDTCKGVKTMDILLHGNVTPILQGVLLRKAPGNTEYDFSQDILFHSMKRGHLPVSHGEHIYEYCANTPTRSSLPTGFVFQIQILKSISDPYYVGLNGLEIYDSRGSCISLTDNNIAAFPESINILNSIDDDVRTPDKLIDGVYETSDPQHMWLTAIIPNVVCKIFVIFDQPVTVSMLKLWNYTKTPSRGVRDFTVLVDDLLIYGGTLQPSVPSTFPGIQPGLVAFTTDRSIIQRAGQCRFVSNGSEFDQQCIRMMNDNEVVNSPTLTVPDQNLRPMTTVRRDKKTKLLSRF